jgi:hypothetical protein
MAFELALAGTCYAAALLCCAGSWRSLLPAPLRLHDALARYGVGSLANTFLPGRAGDAVRLGLFGRVVPGGVLTVAGAVAAVGATRWLAIVPLGIVGTASAFGVPHPLVAALLVVPALELAGVIPLTPANVGVAGGAAALAFHTQGMPMRDALAAGMALHAVETAAGIVVGAGSAVALFRGRGAAPEIRCQTGAWTWTLASPPCPRPRSPVRFPFFTRQLTTAP